MPPVTKTCRQCGTEYKIKASAASKSKFCSKGCHSAAKVKKARLTCPRCGIEFEVPEYHRDRHVYCSKACRGDLKARFEEKVTKVPEGGCWIWEGASPGGRGYGQIRVGDSQIAAHRLAYEQAYEPIPDGMYVCHTCDNPSCVNPEHLFLGTHQDNMDDMTKKDRKPKGEFSKAHKLTDEEVLEIRASSETQQELADRFGVSQRNISFIRNRKTWKHL